MSSPTEGIKYIYDRFKFSQEFYNTARHYREALAETFSSSHKEEVICRSEASDHYKHRNDTQDPNNPVFIKFQRKFTIRDQKRIAQELDNLNLVIDLLETLLYSSGTSKKQYKHKKESLLNYSK